ncbi:O-antigen ligase family protein [Paucibacter sp. XJ19-41]|uniref:O-antigen ligase family protein n=1 Tax=Paucibacter sp. XJ19-41 TaxID=2927824 RepID=UPI00234B7F7E|nr:O-antigen ligase family protein [Paucibacter sp. XJ19-41]MDC6166639.1 hypothetical protein [Paucibacter sp. XJ19-41]
MAIKSPALELRRLPSMGGIGQAAALLGLLLFAAFLGLICVFLPWQYVIILCLASVFPLLAWFSPWAGLFFYLLIALLSPDLKIADLATVVLLIIFSLKIVSTSSKFFLPRQYLVPFLIFIAGTSISLVLAFLFYRNQVPYIYRDGRSFLYWLWLPALYWLTNSTPAGFRKLARTLAAVAALVSIFAIFQWATGIQVIASGRVGALETNGDYQTALTRVQMPGFIFVMLALVWVIVAFAYGRKKWFVAAPIISILLLALYVNFGRALWIWSVAALFLCLFFVGAKRATLMLISLTIIGGVGTVGLSIFKPSIANSISERIFSIADEGGNRTSLGWRKLENEAASSRIASSPVFGVGLGGEYRKWVPELRLFEEHTRYVHNSYLFMALKVGLPATVSILWLIFMSWRAGYRSLGSTKAEDLPLKTAALVTLPAVLGLCFTQPELMNSFSIIFLSALLVILVSGNSIPGDDSLRQSRYRTKYNSI